MKKNVMPKQAAPVERLSPATAGAAGAERGGVEAHYFLPRKTILGILSTTAPFAGDDAE
jgi:prenylated cyclic peptide (anacyclamide/piricyclamide family)